MCVTYIHGNMIQVSAPKENLIKKKKKGKIWNKLRKYANVDESYDAHW